MIRLIMAAALAIVSAVTIADVAVAQTPPTANDSSDSTLPASEWASIRSVIDGQLAAFRQGNAKRAFSFAAPGIQARFGDAATFMRMVRENYAPLLDARYREHLQGAVVEGATIQPLRLVMPDETVLVALYSMQRVGSKWRIAGCIIAPSTVKST
jgi:hypothetical protein